MPKLTCDAKDQAIDGLRDQARRMKGGVQPESLWIMCSDAVMDRAVERVRCAGSAVLLRRLAGQVPEYDPQGDGEPTAIDYAVQELGVREIVVCGHSMCSGIRSEDPAIPRQPQLSGFDSLLQRNRYREAANDRAREHVLQQLVSLEGYPTVSRALGNGQLSIYGLFYLAESGIFTRFDPQAGRFLAPEN